LAWGVSFALPLNQPFRLIFVLPAIIMILAQAAVKFPRTFLLLLLYISVAGLVMTYTRPRLKKEQWRETVAFLEAKEDARSSIILKFSANLAPLEWYAPNLKVLPAVPTFPAQIQQVSTNLVQANLKEQVYVLDYLGELTDPYKTVEQSLMELSYQKQDVFNFEGVGLIHLYIKQL